MRRKSAIIIFLILIMIFSGCSNQTSYIPWPTINTTTSEDGKEATTLGVVDFVDTDNKILKF